MSIHKVGFYWKTNWRLNSEKKVTVPAADLLKEVGSNNALVDVYLHPHENKIIIVEKKEITFSNLRRIMRTTNLIADVELDAEKRI